MGPPPPLPTVWGEGSQREAGRLNDLWIPRPPRVSPAVVTDRSRRISSYPAMCTMPTALALAQQLAEGPASLGATRRLVWRGMEADWDNHLEAERRAQLDAGRTQDFIEGIQAFFQKRPAKFSGT